MCSGKGVCVSACSPVEWLPSLLVALLLVGGEQQVNNIACDGHNTAILVTFTHTIGCPDNKAQHMLYRLPATMHF